jgi:osmoprotectant transport system ATP-binding protein
VKEGDPAKLRREIGYVIQQIGLFPHRTIAENIGTVPSLLGWDKSRIRSRVSTLLELIGLDPEFADRYPGQISGGQQQRVGVARALAVDPPVMLMDEPFGAIDPINRSRLQNEFLRLQAEIRKTVLFVTHDVDEAIKMGDRIAVMKKGGELAQFATPTELLMEPADEFVEDFVGADRALKRLALIRVKDVDLWKAPVARAGDPTRLVRDALESAEVPYAVMVDAENRPLGWLSDKDLVGDLVPQRPGSVAEPLLDGEMTLRDGLATLLASGPRYAAVLDGRGRLDGVLSVEIISDLLSSDPATQVSIPAVERVGG